MTQAQIDALLAPRTVVADENGCWLVQGPLHRSGYAHVWLEGRHQYAHRYVWQKAYDVDLPREVVLDHLCRVRNCVRLDHLEPVDQSTNITRGVSPAAAHAAATHCPQGHPYAGDNLIVRVVKATGRLRRDCRECQRAANRKYAMRRYYERKEARRVAHD